MNDTWAQYLAAMARVVYLQRQEILDEHHGELKYALRNKNFRYLSELHRRLSKILRHVADGNWIYILKPRGIQFEVIWPRQYARQYLFSGVEKVLLVSATLRPKLFGLLGLKRHEVDFKEWPRQFSAALNPVYHIPTVKMSWRSTQQELAEMWNRVDEIIAARPGRRVLVHTHSYDRATFLRDHSRYGKYMILNRGGDGPGSLAAVDAVKKFKSTEPSADRPVILVGPSFSTGWDFPGTALEVNIVVKVPFPDLSSPVMRARTDAEISTHTDKDYANYLAMQDLVQMCGRGSRHDKDRCETFILDNTIQNFKYYAKEHAPRWFDVREIKELPKEPPKL